ncbi:MAG: zinc-binding dehydrogenase [Fibrobacteria bacterium]|nr:zinc-binding dehydrogenase [Fibrobacteria bacterium]
MKTTAVRLYGKNDLRLETFELPPLKDNEILARVVSDSLCMSSYKAVVQGEDHKKVPHDVAKYPTIIGHEFCGDLVKVGEKWANEFSAGQKFVVQPALHYKGSLDAPGYSFRWLGGNATYVVIPNEVMECKCLLVYDGEGYFPGSLSEPVSCVAGAFHASYHRRIPHYIHDMGIKKGGDMAILAGAGPMGLAAIDYALHGDRQPGLLVVTDIDSERLKRAEKFFPIEKEKANGVRLKYINTMDVANPSALVKTCNHGNGFDDVMVFTPEKTVVELGDDLLARDGCLNFFAGPGTSTFKATLNFYNVHYLSTHITGTSGGNTDDMRESMDLIAKQTVNPAVMITHIGGLDAVIPTTLNLPGIPGGKKLIYTNIHMELTAISDFKKKRDADVRFGVLADMIDANNGLWSVEAETYLLNNFK